MADFFGFGNRFGPDKLIFETRSKNRHPAFKNNNFGYFRIGDKYLLDMAFG